jgi:hypothetical protein
MKIARTLIALSLLAGLSTLACSGQDLQDPSGGQSEQVGETSQQLPCQGCGHGDYPDFGTFSGPVGSLVDYDSGIFQVMRVGPSSCNCDSGECPVRNRYNRWICVSC